MGNIIRTQQSGAIAATGAISFLSGNPSSFFAMSDTMQFLTLFCFQNFTKKADKVN